MTRAILTVSFSPGSGWGLPHGTPRLLCGPAVTSAIIGPRTMEHLDSYLASDGIKLSSDTLDRIDEIVPPAATINVADNYWQFGTRSLDATSHRR